MPASVHPTTTLNGRAFMKGEIWRWFYDHRVFSLLITIIIKHFHGIKIDFFLFTIRIHTNTHTVNRQMNATAMVCHAPRVV